MDRPEVRQTSDELHRLQNATVSLDLLAAEHAESLTIEEVAPVLHRLQETISQLRAVEAIYKRWVAAIFKDQKWPTGYKAPHHVEGVGEVTVSHSGTDVWESEALLKVWLEAYLEEHQGETEPWAFLHEIARLLGVIKQNGEYATSASFRKTVLKELGIDPKEYSTVTWGPPSVKVVPEGDADDSDG